MQNFCEHDPQQLSVERTCNVCGKPLLRRRVCVRGGYDPGAYLVGVGRFELPTSRSRTVRSSLAELHPDRSKPLYGNKRLSACRAS